MSTRTSDRYPETLAKRSASSKAARVALVWRRWATVARSGRTTSTRGGLSAFVERAPDREAPRRLSPTIAPAPRPPPLTLLPPPSPRPAAPPPHTRQHREAGHQDWTQTASCTFYCRLPWFAARDPAALSESHEQDGVGHGNADRHDRAHEGLNVERGPGEPKHKHDPGDDGRNRQPHRQGKPERLEIGGQQ